MTLPISARMALSWRPVCSTSAMRSAGALGVAGRVENVGVTKTSQDGAVACSIKQWATPCGQDHAAVRAAPDKKATFYLLFRCESPNDNRSHNDKERRMPRMNIAVIILAAG